MFIVLCKPHNDKRCDYYALSPDVIASVLFLNFLFPLQFLDLFGDAQTIKKADTRHCMLFLRHRSFSISRKRHAEDYLDSEKAKLAKTYMSSAQSVMGAYPNAQAQWPAGYGTKPSTWPQAPAAQGQQWNPAYGQQVGLFSCVPVLNYLPSSRIKPYIILP